MSVDHEGEPRERSLRFGHQGPDVRRLQRTLSGLGLMTAAEDGHFGRVTEGAVRDFQRSHGLRDDGVLGPQTAAALARLG